MRNREITHIEWLKGLTKTHQGGLKKRPRSVSQKIFKIGGPQCPVGAIIKLLSKRQEDMKAVGKLYLSSLRKELDTGHKSEQSLTDYDALNLNDYHHLGKIIGGA